MVSGKNVHANFKDKKGSNNMKKLMTILSVTAVAAFAVGAANGDTLNTGTGFETAGYVAGQDLDTAKDDAGAVPGGNFAPTWAPTNLEDGVAIVTAYDGEGAAVKADVAAATGVAVADLGSNYLKLEGAPLITRYAQTATYDPNNDKVVPNPVDIGDGLYIDTLVQFTAADPETPPTPDIDGGDKLCIWLAENEQDQTQCTLMITAGFVADDMGYIIPTNYATTTTLENNSWHRLQVKALSAIDSDEGDGVLTAGFVVFIDGTAVATTTSPIDSEYISAYTLNARVQRYMTAGSYSLFPSLVDASSQTANTITSLSFQGSGAVDNLTFTQGADIDPILIPQALEPVQNGTEFTYTGSDIEAVSYPDGAYGYEFEDESNIGTEVGEYRTTATPLYGYAWFDGSTTSKTYDWEIVSGGSSSGFDGGEAGKTFTIDAATKTALEAKLPTGKTLGDVADAASGMTYAQAYALGLFDEDTGDIEELDATISVGADGKVTVTLANAPTDGYLVTCKVYEKASLTAEWPSTPVATYAYGSAQAFAPGSATAGFYKVEIVITNALQQ